MQLQKSIVRFAVIPLVFAFGLLIGAAWTAPARSAGYTHTGRQLGEVIFTAETMTKDMLFEYRANPRNVAALKKIEEQLYQAGNGASQVH